MSTLPENHPRLAEVIRLREYVSKDKPKKLREGYQGYDVFRESYTELFDIGEVTSLRCQSHLIGVRMALAQRDNNPFCPEI